MYNKLKQNGLIPPFIEFVHSIFYEDASNPVWDTNPQQAYDIEVTSQVVLNLKQAKSLIEKQIGEI